MNRSTIYRYLNTMMLGALLCSISAWGETPTDPEEPIAALAQKLEVGDVVFIRIGKAPFTQVADTTSSWTNHVGIVSDISGKEPKIAESRVPLSGETGFARFVERSEKGRVAVMRLPKPLDAAQQQKLKQAVSARDGILYDTGFDLHSKRQFCSRYVREVVQDATGVELGEVENFTTLLHKNPQADLKFWKTWYLGYIPWQRETVTPASLLEDKKLLRVFDGRVRRADDLQGDRS